MRYMQRTISSQTLYGNAQAQRTRRKTRLRMRYTWEKVWTRMSMHKKGVHEKLRPYKWDLCGNTFSRKGHMETHRRTVHEWERKFECDVCGGKFSAKSSLKTHKRKQNEKFKCDWCTLGSKTEEDLEDNKRIAHSGQHHPASGSSKRQKI